MIHIKPVTYPHSKLKICQWCNKYFIYTHNRQVYCTCDCKKYARQEQLRSNWQTYYKKYPERANSKKKGSGLLGPRPHSNFESEYYEIQKEMRRIGIRA